MNLIRIEIEIEAREMTASEMIEEGCPEDCAEAEGYIDAQAIGEGLACMFGEDSEFAREMMAGSNVYVVLGEARLIRAEEFPAN